MEIENEMEFHSRKHQRAKEGKEFIGVFPFFWGNDDDEKKNKKQKRTFLACKY